MDSRQDIIDIIQFFWSHNLEAWIKNIKLGYCQYLALFNAVFIQLLIMMLYWLINVKWKHHKDLYHFFLLRQRFSKGYRRLLKDLPKRQWRLLKSFWVFEGLRRVVKGRQICQKVMQGYNQHVATLDFFTFDYVKTTDKWCFNKTSITLNLIYLY